MILSTNTFVFLVKLRDSKSNNICDINGMNEILKTAENGIDFIKFYDFNKQKFSKLSKERLAQLASWHTELTIKLQSLNFIK